MQKSPLYCRVLFNYNYAAQRAHVKFLWPETTDKRTVELINILLKEGAITHIERTDAKVLAGFINYKDGLPIKIVGQIKQLRSAARYIH